MEFKKPCVHCGGEAVYTQYTHVEDVAGVRVTDPRQLAYVCDACGREEEQLIDVPSQAPGVRPSLPTFACPDCQAAMEFDDLPERYLSFLAEA